MIIFLTAYIDNGGNSLIDASGEALTFGSGVSISVVGNGAGTFHGGAMKLPRFGPWTLV